jgi:dGTPase
VAYTEYDRERWVAEDPEQKRADRNDFSRDRARLVHSAALRRLAGKTQILGAGHDDFVRNRLTHSLEVAQIGREFGAALGCDADLVDTACLAHDLGHPPFGHNGEMELDRICADIGGFEGNAQTLRLLTRLEPKRCHPDGRPAGLNLTRASLDAATKYPWVRGDGPVPTPKFGAYDDDLPVFEWMRGDAEPRARCFEAQVMDWSDDVAYSVHDLEDAIASDWMDPRVLRSRMEMRSVLEVAGATYAPDQDPAALAAALDQILATGAIPSGFDGSRNALAALKDMTSRVIGRFVLAVEVATRERYGPGPLCRYEADLVVPDETRAECAVLKAVANQFVVTTRKQMVLKEQQRHLLTDLVDFYAAVPDTRLDLDFRAEFRAAGDDAGRLRVIVDQVASLTDARAVSLHSLWAASTVAHA